MDNHKLKGAAISSDQKKPHTEGCYPLCALCRRPIPPEVPQSRHHLTPKLKGGKHGQTVLLHHLCHKEIHASLSEAELARTYNTIEALRAQPRLAKFILWISRRPPQFASRIRMKHRT